MYIIAKSLLLSPVLMGAFIGMAGCGHESTNRYREDERNDHGGSRAGSSTIDQRGRTYPGNPVDAQAKGAERMQLDDPTNDGAGKSAPTTAADGLDRNEYRPTGQDSRMDATPSSAREKADNTGRNVRDRDPKEVTPGDQSNRQSDIDITSGIRQLIVGNDRFSMLADNIKIMTTDGMVTLRGPVESHAEKIALNEIAIGVRGVRSVDNQLEVLP